MERAWIISSGSELTLGRTVDTNAAWLARQLSELGIQTERIVTVPDDPDALRAALDQAVEATELVLITGGLGPTADDLTRQVLADTAGVALELDAPSLAQLREFFAQRRRDMPESNRVQAMIPRAGRALANTCGTAPGIWLDIRGTPCVALPGVPFEMEAMFIRAVAPQLRAAARRQVLVTRCLSTFGRPESELGALLQDLMARGRNPQVGTNAHLGVIGVVVTATAADSAAGQSLLDQTELEIRARLGPVVFGRDGETLASVVGNLLVSAGQMLATAESCTGGLMGELITEVPGSSRYYVGGVVAYANEAKVRLLGVSPSELDRSGAVSDPVAREMAQGAARVFGSRYALSVTGIAGPDGGSPEKPVGLVFIGLASPAGTHVVETRWGEQTPRQVIRMRAASSALNTLRLELLGERAGRRSGGGA